MKKLLVRNLPNPIKKSPWSGFDYIPLKVISSSLSKRDLLHPKDVIRNINCSRRDHARRIAYLIIYPDNKPITIFKRETKWPIKDGNHRLAAAIYRGDKYIDVNWI